MIKYIKVFGGIILLFIVFIIVPFIKPTTNFINDNCEIWIHKGGGEYNDYRISNIIKVQEEGYLGVEIDLIYKNETIWLCHDYNNSSNSLRLDSVISILDTLNLSYWFDLKSGFDNNDARLLFINTILKSKNLSNRIIIESGNYNTIKSMHQNNILVTYRLRKFNGSFFNKFLSLLKNHLFIITHRPNSIALSMQDYNQWVKTFYNNENVLTWSVNKPKCILEKNEKIKIILKDLN